MPAKSFLTVLAVAFVVVLGGGAVAQGLVLPGKGGNGGFGTSSDDVGGRTSPRPPHHSGSGWEPGKPMNPRPQGGKPAPDWRGNDGSHEWAEPIYRAKTRQQRVSLCRRQNSDITSACYDACYQLSAPDGNVRPSRSSFRNCINRCNTESAVRNRACDRIK